MKLFPLLLLLSLNASSQWLFADTTKQKFARTWYGSSFKLWPNDCQMDDFQKIIDSAASLPGKTLFVLDNPYKKQNAAWSKELKMDSVVWQYCLTRPLTFAYNKGKRKEPWIFIDSPNPLGVAFFYEKTCPCAVKKEKML